MKNGSSEEVTRFLNTSRQAHRAFEKLVGEGRARPSVWPLYLSPDLYTDAVRLLAELINKTVDASRYDYVAGIPQSGHPLTVSLAQRLRKPAVCLPSDLVGAGARLQRARALVQNKRLLLIDSSVNSGLSAALAAVTVQNLGAEPIGVACLFYNDAFPNPVPYLTDLLAKETLWYLGKYSDLI